MATQQVASSVNISDIPEELKPFRMALLNAAFSQAFDPRFLAQQFANWNANNPTGQQPGGTQQPDSNNRLPGDPGYNGTAIGQSYGTPITLNPQTLASLGQSLASGMDPLSGSLLSGAGKTASAKSGQVNLNNVGMPITGTSQPYQTNQIVGGGIGATPTVIGSGNPGITYPAYTWRPPSGGGTTSTNTTPAQPTGTLPPRDGGPMQAMTGGTAPSNQPMLPTGPTDTGWAGGNLNTMTPQQIIQNNSAAGIVPGAVGQTSPMLPSSGYNPSQYATDAVAQQIATALGGTVYGTRTEGPNAPPPQNLINLGIPGSGNMLNAGLVASMLTDPGQAPFAAQRLQDEINLLNHSSPAYMSPQMPVRTSWATPQDEWLKNLTQNWGDVGGMAKGGSVLKNLKTLRYAWGGTVPEWGNWNGDKSANTGSGLGAGGGFTGGVGPNGNPLPIPMGAGFGGGATKSNVAASGGNSSYPYSEYIPYGGQRQLDWTGNPNALQVSDSTRTAEQGMAGNIPSYYDSSGQINAGRNPETGEASTPMGIANDQMDWAGRKIGDAIEGYGQLGTFANRIQHGFTPTQFGTAPISDPTLLSAGQISIDPINRFEMQGPDMVSASGVDTNSMALPRFTGIAGQGADRIPMWTDQGVSTSYMNPYQDQVTQVQRQRAMDDFAEQRGARNTAAVNAGAFGGSRAAVMEGVAQRGLNRQLQAIDANGLNQAYLNGQNQFNADRETGLGLNLQQQQLLGSLGTFNASQNQNAQLANQAARQTSARANLDAALQTQGLATQTGLSAAQSNQNANLAQFGKILDARQEAERMRNQYGLQALQLQDSSNQAAGRLNLDQAQLQGNLGINAMQGLTNAGTSLAGVAASRADMPRLAQQLEQQRLMMQLQSGQLQDARAQNSLNLGYQDFINQRNHPFAMANFALGQLNGVPIGVNQEAIQFQQYSPMSQWGGALASGIGAMGQYLGNRTSSN